MIVPIRYDILTDSIDCNARQTIEFTFTIAILAKLFDKYAIWIEHLYSEMVRNRMLEEMRSFPEGWSLD